MAHRENPFQKIQVVFKRSSKVTKIVLLCAIVFSTVTLLTMNHLHQETKAQNDALQEQVVQLSLDIEKLKNYIDLLGTAEGFHRFCQENDLVSPDQIFLEIELDN